MEVMMRPSKSLDIDYYYSAPTSPSHHSQFHKDFFAAERGGGRAVEAAVPFDWEEKPGTPKSQNIGDHDFAFDVTQEDWETASQLSAEELFHGGVIKPLKPPPASTSANATSPVSQTRMRIQGGFSPRLHKNRGADAFAVAAAPPQRGRSVSESSGRRAARSLSPLRDSREEEESAAALSLASAKGQKKWSLKDLFLFRSASEGRAADKDPLKKYTAAVVGPGSRRRGPVSAHELHYTMNRAVSENLKKKTFLPYKQGILGRLAFNPAVHALANGFGFSPK